MKESQDREVELKSSNAEAFKHLLKYIYTGKICLNELMVVDGCLKGGWKGVWSVVERCLRVVGVELKVCEGGWSGVKGV